MKPRPSFAHSSTFMQKDTSRRASISTTYYLNMHKNQISSKCEGIIQDEIRNHFGELDGANHKIISNLISKLDKKKKDRYLKQKLTDQNPAEKQEEHDLIEFAKSFEFSNYRELREIRLLIRKLAKKGQDLEIAPKSSYSIFHKEEPNKPFLIHRSSTKNIRDITFKLTDYQYESGESSKSD